MVAMLPECNLRLILCHSNWIIITLLNIHLMSDTAVGAGSADTEHKRVFGR